MKGGRWYGFDWENLGFEYVVLSLRQVVHMEVGLYKLPKSGWGKWDY